MFKKTKLGNRKVEEPKVEEPKVEEPKVEEPKVEEPKVEEPKVVDLFAGKKIGLTVILSSNEVVLNNRNYFKLKLADNTETILSREDLETQVK